MRCKLVSPKDTLLGHVDFPDEWGPMLDRAGYVRSALFQRFIATAYMAAADLAPVAHIETVGLMLARWSQYRDAVHLVEGTIEQFETIPGCAFIPGAGYLRSMLD